MDVDYLIVGAGLTGSIIARALADRGENVLIIDRRQHKGGNVYDYKDENGIRIHTYGPHYFRTNSINIWNFVNRYDSFYPYEPVLMTKIEDKFEYWPIQNDYIVNNIGTNWKPSFLGTPSNFEEASLSIMPTIIYERFIRDYNVKQWGVDPKNLDTDLVGRFEVRMDGDIRLKTCRYQGIPVSGYSKLMGNLTKNIETILNVEYKYIKNSVNVKKKTIYTGAIDEFFDFDLGKLTYRGQIREHQHYADSDFILPVGQVNTPSIDEGPHIRILEWKHMMPMQERNKINGTVLTKETPFTPTKPNDYEYPFPDKRNRELFNKYHARLDNIGGVLICGRLGEYRYYDMDQAIERAFSILRKNFNIYV